MRRFAWAAGVAALAMSPAVSAQLFHVSSKVVNGTGGNAVFLFDEFGVFTGEAYEQAGNAAGDEWGYRDGAADRAGFVYFGFGGGVYRHEGAGGGEPTLMWSTPAPGGVWRALSFDPTGDAGCGSMWSADFNSPLVEVSMTGEVLSEFPNVAGWSVYGLAYDDGDGNLWGHDALGHVIKIDTDNGTIMPGEGWLSGFPSVSAQGGLSGFHDGSGRLAAVCQSYLDRLGVYDVDTGAIVMGPWDIQSQIEEPGAVGVAVHIVSGGGCPWDLNTDGVVNVLDLLTVLADWGLGGVPADINADGVVDVLDLLEVLDHWGDCPGERD